MLPYHPSGAKRSPLGEPPLLPLERAFLCRARGNDNFCSASAEQEERVLHNNEIIATKYMNIFSCAEDPFKIRRYVNI